MLPATRRPTSSSRCSSADQNTGEAALVTAGMVDARHVHRRLVALVQRARADDHRPAERVRSESSRRSLMHTACNQLDQGAPADGLSVKLGLRRDELSLMDIRPPPERHRRQNPRPPPRANASA